MLNIKILDKYIFWCMCAFAVVTCINHVIANQILGLAVLVGIIRSTKEMPKIEIWDGYKRALVAFFGVIFISVFVSSDIIESAKEFWRYVNRMIPFLLVMYFIKDKIQLLYVFGAFIISMIINNIYAVYKGVLLIINGEAYLRVTGFESGIIIFSAYLLIALPILVILFFENTEKKWNKYFILTIIIFLIALIMNGTRIAWLIIFVLLPIIFFIYVRNFKKILIAICIGISVLGTICYTMPFMQVRIMSFFDEDNVSNMGHYYIWRDSVAMIKEHPVVGVGLGLYKKVFNEQYRSEEHFKLEDGLTPHAHNNILAIWSETGIFGCIAFCFMYGSFLYYSGKHWIKQKNALDLMLFMITLATVMHGITDFSFGLNQAVKIYFCMLAIYLNYQICDK